MKYNKNSKPNNYLNQYSYDQIKIANKTALKILYEFVDEMFTMFSDIKKYIIKPKQLENMLKNIHYKGTYNYQEIEYCLELSVNEPVKRSDGTVEIYRYYYEDVGIAIHSLIYYKECLVKTESQKMLKFLTIAGQKERDKIRKKTMSKLKTLQDKLFYLIDNDPTMD